MRTVLIAVLLVGLMCMPAMARGSKDICDTPFGAIMNECVVHPADSDTISDKSATEIGVGMDLILLEGLAGEDVSYVVTGEYRYDINNSAHSAYGVLTLKLAELGKAIKGLFK